VNVVYDLRYASDHFAGIGVYAWALLDALLAAPGDERYHVLWGRADRTTRFDPDALARHPRVDWHVVDEPALGWRAPFATGARLRRIRAGVYLSPFYLRPVRPGMPVVLTFHDAQHLAPESGSPPGMRIRFALALRHARSADAILAPSRFARDDIVRRAGVDPARVHVVHHGVPPRAAEPQKPVAMGAEPFALIVGSNRPHKGFATIAAAWRRMGEDAPLDLVWAGAADPRFPSLSDLARSPRARTLGAVSAAELEWLYANATLLVFPTRYEGFGFPLLEACARGTPVLASDIPPLREVGGDAVRFVPVDDVMAWSDAVVALAADASERQRLAAAGRERASQFDFAATAASVRAVLRAVAGAAA